MAVIENSKLTVVGAGSVGASTAYAALIRGSARHVALYDIATAKVEAEVLDLAHGTQFTGTSDIIGGSDISVVEGSHVVVITAGAKQDPGQSRIELAGVNAGILKTMLPQLLEVAPNAIYVIVTNPCDVLTVLAQEQTGLPPERIFASGTVLDTSRLRWRLGQRAGVSTTSVHAYIVGEHGDTEFPLWSKATIGTVPILEWETEGHPRMTPGRTRRDRGRRAGCRVQGHPGQGCDQLRDRPLERADRRGDPRRRARGDAGQHRAARLPRRHRRGPLGAVGGQLLRREADPRGPVLTERARPAAPLGRCPARRGRLAALTPPGRQNDSGCR